MSRVVWGYAEGGNVFDSTAFLSRLFGSAGASRSLGTGAPTQEITQRHAMKVKAEQLLFSLAELGTNLPPPSFGYPLARYLQDILEIIRASNSNSDIEALLNAVKRYRDATYAAAVSDPPAAQLRGLLPADRRSGALP
jgi:hypothetical protein